LTPRERLALLRRILEVYKRRSDEMGDVISREMGAPISMAKTAQSGSGAYHIESFIKTLEGTGQ